MGQDGKRAEELDNWRDSPSVTKEEEITPESPGGALGGDEQRRISAQVQAVMEHRGEGRISREKRHVGNFHHLVADGRNGGFITPVNNVGEPVTVVLDERVVTRRQLTRGSEEHD